MSGSTTTAEKLVETTMSNIKETMKTLITTTTEATKAASAAIAASASTTTTTSSISSSSSSPPSVTSPAHHHHHGNDGEKILNVSDLSTSMQHFGVMDYCVFVLMLIVCAGIGFYFGFIEKKTKKTKNVEHRRGSEALDYLVGGRKMKVFPVSLSLVASFVSGISLLGTSTEIYVYGTQYAFILITLALSGVISWYVFLPVFCNLQLTSTYEYFEMRFGKTIRLIGSILFSIGTLIWLPIVIYVPALAFNQVTGVNIHIITPVVCIVCIFYTCVGGLKAVIWTDVIQTVIMIGSITFVIIKGTIDVGGFGVVFERNYATGRLEMPEWTWDPTARTSMLSILLGTSLYFIQVSCGNQVIVQRYLSVPSVKEAKQACIIYTLGIILVYVLTFYNGLLIFANYHDCDPLSTQLAKAKDQLVPLMVMKTLEFLPGMAGLFVAGVFSAALSSLSTGLNSLAAVFLEDYIKPYRKTALSESQTAFIMRLIVVLVGVLSVALVFVVEYLGHAVLQLSATLSAVTGGPLLSLFLMGLLMPWINSRSAITGCLISFAVMTWVCVRGQIALATGELVYAEKPVSTEGCTYDFEPLYPLANSTITDVVEASTKTFAQYIYTMSFTYYAAVGCFISVLFANLATFIYGRNDVSTMNRKLFAPCIRRFIKSKEYDTVLKEEKSYFEMRFGKSIRYFCSILFTVGTILYLPVAMYVPALTFSQVSGLGVHTITPVVCIVCTFYTCVGGLKAVVWTDAVQSFVMYGTILTICIKGTLDLGGLGEVLERNLEGGRLIFPDLSWDPTVRLSMSAIFVGSVLHKIQSNDVNQMSLQRFMSLPDTGKVKQCLILFTILLMFLLSCCCYMGLLTYATYYDCDPLSTKLAQADDQLPTILVMRILGSIPGLPGLFVAGVFSAALSSLSTGLNSMACVISEDLVKPFVNLSEKQTGFLLRGIVAFFGLSCIPMVYLVERMGTVLQLATMMGAVTMGPILGFYTTGICMPWIKEKSCLLGGVVSFLTLGWICVNAQMGQMSGEIRHPKLPISVEGCTYPYDNATYWERHNYTPSERNIYHLSFMWYTGMGGIIGCVVANLACLIFGCTKAEDINHDLISPVIRKYFPLVAKETIVMTEVQESKEPLYKFKLDKDIVVRKHSLDKME